MTTPPPCAGQWRLFDSTDEFDHLKARTLCGECPMLVECRQRLTDARNRAQLGQTHSYGPQGTWAGRLVGAPRSSAARIAAEDSMFTTEELRDAHAAWSAGVRDERTAVGERIYQRKRSRRRYQQKKSGAAA